MALIKIVKSKFKDDRADVDLLNYVTDPCKAISGLMGGKGVVTSSVGSAVTCFRVVRRSYMKDENRRLTHAVISFPKQQVVTPEEAFYIGNRVLQVFDGFQGVHAVHENTDDVHIHLALNAVSYRDGHKLIIDNQLRQTLGEEVDRALAELRK